MKHIIYLIAVIAIGFTTSCEKRSEVNEQTNQNANVKFEQTGDPYDYVFVNPKWEVVDKDYTDDFGNNGILYINANNPIEKYFVIKNQTKECGATNSSYKGEKKVYFRLHASGIWLPWYRCEKKETSQNCQVTIYYDEYGCVCSSEFKEIYMR